MNIRDMQKFVFDCAVQHGWWNKFSIGNESTTFDREKLKESIPEKLCLIHSEVSEALEVYREHPDEVLYSVSGTDEKPIGFDSELADIVIRVMDLAEALGIDLEGAIIQKHKYNKTRPFMHGGKAI